MLGEPAIYAMEPRHIIRSNERIQEFLTYYRVNLPDVSDRPDIPDEKVQFWLQNFDILDQKSIFFCGIAIFRQKGISPIQKKQKNIPPEQIFSFRGRGHFSGLILDFGHFWPVPNRYYKNL